MSNANSAGRTAASASPQRPPPPAPQALRLTPQRLLYGVYTWMLLLLLGIAALPVLLLLPRLSHRRAVVRTLARLILRLAGMPLELHGIAQLPSPCIVVANHSSYLDGVVMAAALPPSFSFVIKREMASVPIAGTLLRRIGAEFVERRDRARGARDARRLLRNAEHGHALVFFPEGTFSREIGLLRFHIGAFTAAVRAGLAVVPVAISGTRDCLPPGSAWPRAGAIRIHALPPLAPPAAVHAADGDDRAPRLRDAARSALLAALGEPDLAAAAAPSAPAAQAATAQSGTAHS
jgi:1-acyl-sn-glycerol-3-phosphate acyltransferase